MLSSVVTQRFSVFICVQTKDVEILIYTILSASSNLRPLEFEKDDDGNGHIDLITALAVSKYIT